MNHKEALKKLEERFIKYPFRFIELDIAAQVPHRRNPDAVSLSTAKYKPLGRAFGNNFKLRDYWFNVIDRSYKNDSFTMQRSNRRWNQAMDSHPEFMEDAHDAVEEKFPSLEECEKACREGRATKHFWSKSRMRTLLTEEKGITKQQRRYLEVIKRLSFQSIKDTMVLYTLHSERRGKRITETPSFQSLPDWVVEFVAPKNTFKIDVDQVKTFASPIWAI